MKKIVSILLSAVMAVSLAACGSSGAASSLPGEAASPLEMPAESSKPAAESSGPAVPAEPSENLKEPEPETQSLVVYFSWSGNTESVALEIQSQTGADLFEIVPETPYTSDYSVMLDIAATERNNGARPAFTGSIENFADYDTIYVGYPNWWGDLPMILYAFFDSYDCSGKTVAPFCTSGGSSLSDTVDSIRELEPDAAVTEGLHINGENAANPAADVAEWLESIA